MEEGVLVEQGAMKSLNQIGRTKDEIVGDVFLVLNNPLTLNPLANDGRTNKSSRSRTGITGERYKRESILHPEIATT